MDQIEWTGILNPLEDTDLVLSFYDLLASVEDEEFGEVFHDFMVPSEDQSPADAQGAAAHTPRCLDAPGTT